MKLLFIGGLGIETKSILSENGDKEVRTLGGSAWHMALTGKALGCQSAIIASVGNDSLGLQLLDTLIEHNIDFLGVRVELTQEYFSIIKNGVSISFSSTLENITANQVSDCFEKNIECDIIFIGYVSYEALLVIMKYQKNAKRLFSILNMSDSILSIPADGIIDILSSFDIVTMNLFEAEKLAEKLNLSVDRFMTIINYTGTKMFVTSMSSIKYIIGNDIFDYDFPKLNSVFDSTGAGDAFAVSIGIGQYNKTSLDNTLKQAIHSAHSMCSIVEKENIADYGWKIS